MSFNPQYTTTQSTYSNLGGIASNFLNKKIQQNKQAAQQHSIHNPPAPAAPAVHQSATQIVQPQAVPQAKLQGAQAVHGAPLPQADNKDTLNIKQKAASKLRADGKNALLELADTRISLADTARQLQDRNDELCGRLHQRDVLRQQHAAQNFNPNLQQHLANQITVLDTQIAESRNKVDHVAKRLQNFKQMEQDNLTELKQCITTLEQASLPSEDMLDAQMRQHPDPEFWQRQALLSMKICTLVEKCRQAGILTSNQANTMTAARPAYEEQIVKTLQKNRLDPREQARRQALSAVNIVRDRTTELEQLMLSIAALGGPPDTSKLPQQEADQLTLDHQTTLANFTQRQQTLTKEHDAAVAVLRDYLQPLSAQQERAELKHVLAYPAKLPLMMKLERSQHMRDASVVQQCLNLGGELQTLATARMVALDEHDGYMERKEASDRTLIVVRSTNYEERDGMVKSPNKFHVKRPSQGEQKRLAQAQALNRAFNQIHDSGGRNYSSHPHDYLKAVRTLKAQRCGTLTVNAMDTTASLYPKMPIAKLSFGGHHALEVIGTVLPGDVNRPLAQWKSKVMFCDPWLGISCTAQDFPAELRKKMQQWQAAGKQVSLHGQWVDPMDPNWLNFIETNVVKRSLTKREYTGNKITDTELQ